MREEDILKYWPSEEPIDRRTRKERLRDRQRANNKLPIPTRRCPTICECCGGLPGKLALHLDHDHKTNKFRGWLCGKCNIALGLFGDSKHGLQMALAYLDRFEKRLK